MPIRILLADDHTVMRSGLRLLLERQPNLQVIGEAADGRQAVDMAAAEKDPVAGYHFSFPSVGHVEKDGAGYRLTPMAWNPAI